MNADAQRDRVVKLTDGILAIMAGNDRAEVETAVTLAVVATICTHVSDNAATRYQAAEGFSRQVRELIHRDDIVEWIKASVHWPPSAGKIQ